MSTWIYLECQDHDPPIRSNAEVGQHLSDLDAVRQMFGAREALANAVAAGVDAFGSGWHDTAAHFFAAHPKCTIKVRDEYGEEHAI